MKLTKSSALKILKELILSRPDSSSCKFMNQRVLELPRPVHAMYVNYPRGHKGEASNAVTHEANFSRLYWYEQQNRFYAEEPGCSPETLSNLPAEVIIEMASVAISDVICLNFSGDESIMNL